MTNNTNNAAEKSTFTLTVDHQPSNADIADIQSGLRDFNRAYLPDDIPDQPIAVFVRNESNDKIAGITARIRGTWLMINYLWVDESHRHHGLGSQLITTLENNARELGCLNAQLDTFDFQAEAFYHKMGYETRLTLADNPLPGRENHYLTKSLV